jgi:hypothetical protein
MSEERVLHHARRQNHEEREEICRALRPFQALRRARAPGCETDDRTGRRNEQRRENENPSEGSEHSLS